MIDHTAIHVANLGRSRQFYEATLLPLGYVLLSESPTSVSFGSPQRRATEDPAGAFWIVTGTPFTPRNHIAFHADTRDRVRAFHEAAIRSGAADNGGPGLRERYHPCYYAAFVWDPDGYNIEAVCHAG